MKEYLNRSREGRKGMRGIFAAHAGNFWCPIYAAASSLQHFACFAASVQTLHFGSSDAGLGETAQRRTQNIENDLAPKQIIIPGFPNSLQPNGLQTASYGMPLK